MSSSDDEYYAIPNLDYKERKRIDIDAENKRSIIKVEDYIINALNNMCNIMKAIISLENDLHDIYNDLNILSIDKNMLSRYNRSLSQMYGTIKSILDMTVTFDESITVHPIKPVDSSNSSYCHTMKVGYTIPGPQYIMKELGEITNVSIGKLSEQITLEWGKHSYTFVDIDDESIERDAFRDHLTTYIENLNQLKGWCNNDLNFINKSYQSLENIINDIEMRTRQLKFKKNLYKKSKSKCQTSSIFTSTSSGSDQSSYVEETATDCDWSDMVKKIRKNADNFQDKLNISFKSNYC